MQGREFKDAIYGQFAQIGRAISSPKRLELLDLLCQGPRTVEVLARETGQTVANASQHLQVLRASRLVEAEKHGLFVTYRLAGNEVCEFYRLLRLLAESHLAEIDRIVEEFLDGRDDMEPVDKDDLVRRVTDGSVTVLDVRPPEEFAAAHIPGARSMPLRELARRLEELPKDQEIVAYCRGPYCVLAVEAVELLRQRGFRALRLEDGVADWRARGLPVAVGAEPAQKEMS